VFLENMVQFGFEFAHRNISRFGLAPGRHRHGWKMGPRLLSLP